MLALNMRYERKDEIDFFVGAKMLTKAYGDEKESRY